MRISKKDTFMSVSVCGSSLSVHGLRLSTLQTHPKTCGVRENRHYSGNNTWWGDLPSRSWVGMLIKYHVVKTAPLQKDLGTFIWN